MFRSAARSIRFTLVELLVVVAIIAILMALLFPSLKSARDMAKRIECSGKLKQMGIASVSYAADWSDYFPLMTHPVDTNQAWQPKIDPYLNITWNAGKPTPKLFRCPSQTQGVYDYMGEGDYAANCYLVQGGDFVYANYGGFVSVQYFKVKYPGISVWLTEQIGEWQRAVRGTNFSNPLSNIYRHNLGANFIFVDNHAQWMGFKDLASKRYFINSNWAYGWRDGMIY